VECRRNDPAAMVKLQREHSRTDGELCRKGLKPRPGQLEGRSQKGEAEWDRKPDRNDGTPRHLHAQRRRQARGLSRQH
jgi:hypothetical protein